MPSSLNSHHPTTAVDLNLTTATAKLTIKIEKTAYFLCKIIEEKLILQSEKRYISDHMTIF